MLSNALRGMAVSAALGRMRPSGMSSQRVRPSRRCTARSIVVITRKLPEKQPLISVAQTEEGALFIQNEERHLSIIELVTSVVNR